MSNGTRTMNRRHTKEESSKKETHEVPGETGGDGDSGPGHHDANEEGGDLDSGDEHVGGDTSEDVSDKKNRNTGLVLNVGKTKIVFERRYCHVSRIPFGTPTLTHVWQGQWRFCRGS